MRVLHKVGGSERGKCRGGDRGAGGCGHADQLHPRPHRFALGAREGEPVDHAAREHVIRTRGAALHGHRQGHGEGSSKGKGMGVGTGAGGVDGAKCVLQPEAHAAARIAGVQFHRPGHVNACQNLGIEVASPAAADQPGDRVVLPLFLKVHGADTHPNSRADRRSGGDLLTER